MKGFVAGFEKVAASTAGALATAKNVGKGALRVGKGALSGGKESLKGSIGDALKMKGLSHLSDAYKAHGVSGLKTRAGQKAWGEALGKAAPSLAAAGGYAAGAKKIYEKTMGGNSSQGQGVYY